MGYTVKMLVTGGVVEFSYKAAIRIDVKQNHLFLYDKAGDVIAVYQSGWWISAYKNDEN
jgi:hypothetical protein